jgi:hypothetical protein
MSRPPREVILAADNAATDDAETRIHAKLTEVATSLDATEETLVVARRHIPLEPTVRELLAEVHGAATLGVFLLERGQDPLAFPSHLESVEQDCYNEAVEALGWDPLADGDEARGAA